ncbi:hypothetical protein L596_008409 [Steinernema carpocapsae]|uniref:Uncharacterized protein n=1 Tax=Steinernema carpocapsae TaxID=34508 RepID=A0A4U5PCJ0_STECR|nr:hypothetical protein L596_008409 [Steinernema carpocapsae]
MTTTVCVLAINLCPNQSVEKTLTLNLGCSGLLARRNIQSGNSPPPNHLLLSAPQISSSQRYFPREPPCNGPTT